MNKFFYLDSNRGWHKKNCVHLDMGASYEHNLRIFNKAWALRAKGHDVITRCIFTSGDVGDLLDLKTEICYEFVNTETEKRKIHKANDYPVPVEFVDVNSSFEVKAILMDAIFGKSAHINYQTKQEKELINFLESRGIPTEVRWRE